MTLSRRSLFVLFAAAALLLVAAAWLTGARLAVTSASEAGARQLQIITLDLESILERYETLPYALSFQPEAEQALAHPESAALILHLNTTLRAIQRQAKVAAIYLMDPAGKTIAASNWDTSQSYIGQNFSFRPYFFNALHGEAGRFYGIGSTTAEPGYFIAQPVYAGGREAGKPIGVIAVKIRLDDFALAWKGIDEAVALVDCFGVVFLSNRQAWRYHSLTLLSEAAQKEISSTLQYMDRKILPLAPQSALAAPEVQPVGRLGWQLMMFPSQAAITRSAFLWALAAALLLAVSALFAWAFYQRRRRLEERGIARAALQQAADELERKIVQRTAELTMANQSIEAKYAKLKETELLLRNTQNELVQAGKLTMLGQMAAGVTHELSQPLTAIRAFADNARTFLARGQAGEATENLGFISSAAERMGAMIGQLKGFARKSESQLAPVDLALSIRSSVRLLESDIARSGCALQLEIAEPLLVTGDAVRIEQVLINLLRNALEAAASSPAKTVWLRLQRDGDVAVVAIRDSGAGLSSEAAARLFEPFFTTKSTGEGLGLGLAISSSIVQAMDGQLEAHNHAEGGAEFLLRLALSAKPG